MGFESGSVSFRMFYVPGGLPTDCVRRFAKHAAPPIQKLGREAINGWVSGRHLLDREIDEDNAFVGGYLRLTLMKAERKIPDALLRAECRIQELAELRAEGGASLKRERRVEIRKEIIERLMPNMPPMLTGIPMVYDGQSETLYAGATGEKQTDVLVQAVKEAVDKAPVPVTAASAAMRRKKVNVRDLDPTSFSPELENELASDSLGQDFLTWLWFHSEAGGGLVDTDRGQFAVAIQGPLAFVLEGEGAHETLLRKGSPLVSSEAKTALLSGKKLISARLIVARGDEQWEGIFDAERFAFRSLKVPKGQPLDPISRFQERMVLLETFREGFFAFFDRFLADRADAAKWKPVQKSIHQWVAGRTTKR